MSRIVYNMDMGWRFRPDSEADTVVESNSHASSYNSCKAGAAGSGAAIHLDDNTWREVDLPHDYYAESDFSENNLISHGYRTRGNAWYRKAFYLDQNLAGKQVFLCFEGTAVNAEFYVNGSLMDRSFSAYTESAFDITDRVYFGKDKVNLIAVRIDGMATEGWWYEGAGIYRHVHLYVKDMLHIAHNGIYGKPVLRPGTKNSWVVEVETEVENRSYETRSGTVHAALYDGDVCVAEAKPEGITLPFTTTGTVRQKLAVSRPTRWDVDCPKLYTLRVTVERDGEEVDADETRIGFRTFRVDAERGFFLNDRPLKIKGTCNHQDHAGVGVAVPDSVQYYRIRRLKEMGTNAYRCSHNLPTKAVLDACDELGMIVMDENRRFESRDEVLRYLDIMVKRDRNHPSVIFWSLFNEEPLQNTPEGANIFRHMKSRVLHLDDTRLITGAINGSMEGAGLEMDVTGINYGLAGIPGFHEKYPHQPIIGSENNSAVTTRGCYRSDREGAQVLSNYDEEAVPWGQTVRETWDFVRKNEYFAGIFIWTGFDYRGEPTPFTWPSVSSQFGILDTCGFPKDAFFYNKACFTEKPMVHLLPHWNWKKGETVRVAAPTNCEEVELFLNGKSLGRKTGDCIATPEWQVTFAPGRLVAKGYRRGKCVAKDEVRTAGKPYAVRLLPDRTTVQNDGEDTVPVNVAVVDRRGVVVPDASHLLTFTVTGDGFVRGVGNGDPNSHEPDTVNYRHAYCGLCQALLTAKTGAKTLALRVEGEGLVPAEMTFDVEEVPRPLYMKSVVGSGGVTAFTVSAVTAERPDPLIRLSDNDMNSFTPIETVGHHQGDFCSGWRVYRALTRMRDGSGFHMIFPNLIADDMEVYLNGKKVYEMHTPFNGQTSFTALDIPLRDEDLPPVGEMLEFRLLLYIKDAPWAGIRDGFRLVPDED